MRFDDDYTLLIGGDRKAAAETFGVVNPATGAVFAQAPAATAADLDRAVTAARDAFPGWAATPIESRRAKLIELGDAVIAHLSEFADLLTREQGKPVADAQAEVFGAGYWLKATAALDLPVTINEDSDVRYSETRRVPIGVVAAIAPWNFPMLLAMFKIAPALLAGNTVVLKPSPFTPLTTLRFGQLVADILPPGVLNVLSGGDDLGPLMTSHPGFDKLSFTGSTATGRHVARSAAAGLKRLTLELGGNDAAIVLADAEVEKIVEPLFWAAFGNNGQTCIATKRLYIHADVYEPLKAALITYAKGVKVGDGAEAETRLGPVSNAAQYARVLDLIADAKARGYRFALGGDIPDGPGFYAPITLIDNPPEDSRIVQEEQFGPVLPLLKYDDEDEVIARVNGTGFGLACSIWGSDDDRAWTIARRIEAGTVWVNEAQHLSPTVAFGGLKQSGLGVEGGVEGLLQYTNAQTLTRKRPVSA